MVVFIEFAHKFQQSFQKRKKKKICQMRTLFKVCGKVNLKGTQISLSFLSFVYLAGNFKRISFIIQSVFAEHRLLAMLSFRRRSLC